ncbi:TonB family protein [Piscinibacter gummiphilus]|uniref:TonB family protein n=1 Tax=Piscinibacter gummiphilus TaxID=946333 RepID=UPI0039B8AF3D
MLATIEARKVVTTLAFALTCSNPCLAQVYDTTKPGCPNFRQALQSEGFPNSAERLGLDQGSVTVEFTLNPDGSTANPTILKSSHNAFNRPTIERISKLKCAGDKHPVRVQFSAEYKK